MFYIEKNLKQNQLHTSELNFNGPKKSKIVFDHQVEERTGENRTSQIRNCDPKGRNTDITIKKTILCQLTTLFLPHLFRMHPFSYSLNKKGNRDTMRPYSLSLNLCNNKEDPVTGNMNSADAVENLR